jgi:hypothetical protein
MKKSLLPLALGLCLLAGSVVADSDVAVKIERIQDPTGMPWTRLILIGRDGSMLAGHEDVHVNLYEQAPNWFPYLVIETSTGGSGCCIKHYFYDKRGNFKNPTVMSNSSVFLRIMKSGDGFFVYSATGQSVLLK